MLYRIDEIWLEEEATDYPLTQEILGKLRGTKVFIGDEIASRQLAVNLAPDPFRLGKRILRLMKHRGTFVKPCPGTPAYICCGLEIVHIGQGCPMDCRYCALQAYLNRPVLELFVNVDDMMDAVRQHLTDASDVFHRLCTGEFTDSLALEPLTGVAAKLIECVSSFRNACLELKTKSYHVPQILFGTGSPSVVVSFSVNTSEIIRQEEFRSATLPQRIAAAVRVQAHGYKVGFHFDPIIPIKNWEEAYLDIIDRVYGAVDREGIAWISLGVLRFVPELKVVASDRFGPIPYYHDGFVRGLDGKRRLPADRRIQIYRRIAERIRFHHPDARVYLCMESLYVWKESLGIILHNGQDLARYLEAAVKKTC